MAGVSLIELIVTLGLLAIVALGTFGFYVNGIRAGQHAEGLATATSLAQARLEDFRSSLLLGDIGEAQLLSGYSESVEVRQVVSGLQQVTVTISWSWRGEKRETTLNVLVMDPR
jgi:Tfp pilus assembly protein PilV